MHTHGQKHIPFLSISLAASPLPTQQSSSRAMQQEYRRTCLPEHYTTLAQCRGCQERGENRGRRGHQGKGTGQDTAAARRQSSLWPAVAGIHSELKPWPTARGYGCRSTVSQQFRCEGWENILYYELSSNVLLCTSSPCSVITDWISRQMLAQRH